MFERHTVTEKTASLSLDLREKGPILRVANRVVEGRWTKSVWENKPYPYQGSDYPREKCSQKCSVNSTTP